MSWILWALGILAILAGPGTLSQTGHVESKPFRFPDDSFAFENQLAWTYQFDTNSGSMRPQRRSPRPDYALRCFALVRAARQFTDHARFEPNEPKADAATYRHLVRRILARSPRHASPRAQKLVVPGYSNLREFSADQEPMLKAECGPAWQSFVQRGNWRMVFPFTRRQQAKTARDLRQRLRHHRPLPVHVVCFPSLALNHVVLVFAVGETEDGFEFTAYDPNDAGTPIILRYHQRTRRFAFPPTDYFPGGPVNLYEIYRGICY